jgi:hypothetical protein
MEEEKGRTKLKFLLTMCIDDGLKKKMSMQDSAKQHKKHWHPLKV